jgi:hypothetical protein
LSHFSQSEIVPKTNQSRHYGNLLIGAGMLWLLLTVALLVYQASDPAKVKITWETATEQQTAGFNLYKSSEPDHGFKQINNDQLIAGRGGPVSGASYSFIDNEVEGGKTYFYILEEVELDGSQNRYEDQVFAYAVPSITGWLVALTIGGGLIGTVLIVSGLKENKKP